MRFNTVLLFLSLLAALEQVVDSAPTLRAADNETDWAAILSSTEDNLVVLDQDQTITTTEIRSTSTAYEPPNDEALNDEDFERLVERLAIQSKESVSENLANYVSEDTDVDEIVRMIETLSSTEDNRVVQDQDSTITTTEISSAPAGYELPTDDELNDEDFERLVERLERQSKQSVSENMANYVSEDTDVDEIVRVIETMSSTESSLDEPTSTASDSPTTQTRLFDEENYVNDDLQFEALLKRFKDASKRDISMNRNNYASDDMSDQELQVLAERLAKEAEDENTCPICREQDGTELVETECHHRFHYQCIRNWYHQNLNRNCPICRRMIARPIEPQL